MTSDQPPSRIGAPPLFAVAKRRAEMELMGVLANEIAHELSGPLTRIVVAGHKLAETAGAPAHQGVAVIEREAHRASRILECFAMLSPRVPLRQSAVSLAGLVEEAISLVGVRENSRLQLREVYDRDLTARVNSDQILQALSNILENAWEAMPGGGALCVSVQAMTHAGRRLAVITISDEGPGVAAEMKDRLFEPFATTKRNRPGRGVGLAITHAMIERHGGTIFVESPVKGEQGTRVTIRLPLGAEEGE